jgi:hypothetical protein
VIEVADIFRRFADRYLAAHGAAMPPSHRRAIADILACRTPVQNAMARNPVQFQKGLSLIDSPGALALKSSAMLRSS